MLSCRQVGFTLTGSQHTCVHGHARTHTHAYTPTLFMQCLEGDRGSRWLRVFDVETVQPPPPGLRRAPPVARENGLMSPRTLSTVLLCMCLCQYALISHQHVSVCGWSELFLEYKMRSQMETAEPEVVSVVMPTTTTTTTTQLHFAGTPSHR